MSEVRLPYEGMSEVRLSYEGMSEVRLPYEGMSEVRLTLTDRVAIWIWYLAAVWLHTSPHASARWEHAGSA